MPVSGNLWKAILPIMGKLLAHVEKAAFPCGASTVPQVGKHSAQNCAQSFYRRKRQ